MSIEADGFRLEELPLFPFTPEPMADPLVPVIRPAQSQVSKVYRVTMPTGQWAWVVASHQGVREVLGSPSFSANVRLPGFPLLQPLVDLPESQRPGLFSRTDGPAHRRFRRALGREFTLRAIKGHVPMIERAVDEALNEMEKSSRPVNLIDYFAQRVPSRVICEMLGVTHDDHLLFERCTKELQTFSTSPKQAGNAANDLRGYLNQVIAARMQDGRRDSLIGRMAADEVATGRMTSEELAGAATLLIIAGHESTADALGLGVYYLLLHPEVFRVLVDRSASARALAEELLRILTPQRAGLRRIALVDTTIDGQLIQAGEGVVAMTPAANYNADVFRDPDALKIDRASASEHLSFGYGEHYCIGHHLARAEMEIALTLLAERFPRLALAVTPEEVPIRYDGVVFGLDELLVTW